MIIKTLQNKIECKRCAGYGVFGDDMKLTHCKSCGSIHAESLGMNYRNGVKHQYMYVETSLLAKLLNIRKKPGSYPVK